MLVVPDNSVYDRAHMLKSDMLGRKVQIKLVFVKDEARYSVI